MRLLQEVPPRVHALLASVLLGSGVVSLTPGFADTTVFLLPRPDVEFFLYSPWLTFVEDVSGTQEVESATIDLPAKSLVYVREPNGHRTTDDLSEQDVFGYEIALSDVWNQKALTRFFENLESRTRHVSYKYVASDA